MITEEQRRLCISVPTSACEKRSDPSLVPVENAVKLNHSMGPTLLFKEEITDPLGTKFSNALLQTGEGQLTSCRTSSSISRLSHHFCDLLPEVQSERVTPEVTGQLIQLIGFLERYQGEPGTVA
ncbi:unnamed protein product [Caretta caretta]